jgi:hypothetical protein
MITLITTLYDVKDPKRLEENQKTIFLNVKNKYIKKIIIFYEGYNERTTKFNLNHEKIEVINTKIHQTYKILFEYANNFLKDKIVIIANTDILFDNTINLVNRLDFNSKYLCALTRWDKENEFSDKYFLLQQEGKNVSWSFDSYIFKSPINFDSDSIDIKVGVAGCDTLLIKRLCYDNLFIVTNPCLDIITYHIDNYDRKRTYEISKCTYWNSFDYPAPWNKNFHNIVKHINCPIKSYDGIKISNLDNDNFTPQQIKNFQQIFIKSF